MDKNETSTKFKNVSEGITKICLNIQFTNKLAKVKQERIEILKEELRCNPIKGDRLKMPLEEIEHRIMLINEKEGKILDKFLEKKQLTQKQKNVELIDETIILLDS